jgi:hypothetical protein
VFGEILTFAALTAPEPMSILELLLVTTTSAAAVSVVVVVLLIAPLVRSSIFPEVVRRFSLTVIGEVLEDEPTIIEEGLLEKISCDCNSKVALVPAPPRVAVRGLNSSGPVTLKSNAMSL